MLRLLVVLFTLLATLSCWGATGFTDAELESVLRNDEAGIIYLWSPYMPLSVQGREEVIEVAKKLNVSLTLLVDPLAKSIETEDAFLASPGLMKMGMLDHYPAIVLHKNGKLLEVIVHGYEPGKTLTPMIDSYLKAHQP